MAEIAKSGTPSLATSTPPNGCKATRICGEAIAAGDMVYIKSDGKFWLASGAAADAKAQWVGMSATEQTVGEPLTAYRGVRFHYGAGLTPGARLYLSATVPGGLADAPTTGSPAGQPAAYAFDDTRIEVLHPAR